MRPTIPVLCILALAGGAIAADAKPAAPKKLSAMDLIAEEEKWLFQPSVGREDIFIDLDQLLTAQKQAKASVEERKRTPTVAGAPIEPQGADIEQLVAWAKGEDDRIRQAVAARKYEDAIKVSDATLKQLETNATRPELVPILVSIRTYRAQAEEAKIRNDAQTAFDALKIRLLGVLWSQEGTRLAILDGSNRALSVNEHFKDCLLINIDQDRVDFRFNFQRRRFEFPVYVDQPTGRTAP